MKKLLSILLLFVGFAVHAQYPSNYVPLARSYGNGYTRLWADSVLHLPLKKALTLNDASTMPQIFVHGTTLYFTDSAGNIYSAVGGGTGIITASGDASGTASGTNLPLTLATVNANLFGANTLLAIAVDGKGRTISARAANNSDITNALGFVPINNATTITINGITQDLTTNRSWLIPTDSSFLDSLFTSPLGTINFGTSGDSVTADVNVSPNSGNILTNNGGLYVPSSISNGLLSGGIITWVTGLTYQISAAIYVINGVTYSSPARTFTLAAADPSLNRSDAIVVTIADTAGVITGIPNTPAVDPNVNPSSQLKIGNILVGAGTTAPTINVENIYLENTEWTTAVSNARINAASTNFPFAGTKDVEATAARNGDSVTFTKSGSVTTANFTTLTFQLRLKAAFTNSSAIILHFASGVNYTLSTGTVGSYAVVSIPLAAFAPLATTLGKLTVKISTTGGRTIGFYIDNIQLQGAAATTTPPGNYVTNAGASISLTAGTFAARPTAGVLGRYYAAIGTSGNDSTFYYDNGSSWIPFFKTPVVPIIRVAYLGGTNGDSLVQANNGGDTLYSRRIRDSLGFHIVHNADGSETWYSSGSGLLFGQSDVTATADRAFNANSHAFHIYNLPDLTFSLPNGAGVLSIVDTPSNVVNTIVPYSFGAGTSGGFDYHFTNLQGGPWGADINVDSTQLKLSWTDGTNNGSYTVNSTSAEFSTTGAFFLSGSRYAFDGNLPSYLPSTDTTLSNPFLVGTDGKWHITDWASLRSALGSGQNIDQVLGVGDTAYGKTMFITNGAGTKTYESFGQNFFEAIGTDQDSASITVINSTMELVARGGLTFQGAGVHSTSGVTLKTQDADFTGDLMYFPNTTNLKDTLATKYDIRQAISGGSSGTVTSFSAGNLAPLFTTSVATSTSTPALTFTLTNAAAHTLLGNNTGSSAAPSYLTTTQVTADLNLFSSSLQGLVPGSGGGTTNFLRADGTWAAPTGSATIGGSIASTQVGVGSGTNTISGSANLTYSSSVLTELNNSITTTITPTHILQNSTAATVSVTQYSPSILLMANGWGTTGGTSQAMNIRFTDEPSNGTNSLASLNIDAQVAANSYANLLSVFNTVSDVAMSSVGMKIGSSLEIKFVSGTGTAISNYSGGSGFGIDLDDNNFGTVMEHITSATGYLNTKMFIGGTTTASGAWATLAAGSTTVAPLKFTSGTNLTTTVAGAVEYDGSHLYFSASNGGTRFQLDQQTGGFASLASPTFTGTPAAPTATFGDNTTQIATDAFVQSAVGGVTTINLTGLAATTSPALTVANTTAAISGTQQVSPGVIFGSFGFGTTAGTSQAVNGRIFVTPTQSTVPTGEIDFGFSIAGGAYNTPFKILSNGSIVSSSTITSGAGYLATTGSPYSWNVANNSQLIGGDFNSTVSVRNSTAAQAVRIFNTFTSTTNYEAANLGFIDNTNIFTIATSKGTTGTQRGIRIDGSTAGIGIGTTPGTSSLMNFAAGTTTQAPAIFAAGTNLTTAVAGAFEFDGTSFYLSPSTTRFTVALTGGSSALANSTTITCTPASTALNFTLTLSTNTTTTINMGTIPAAIVGSDIDIAITTTTTSDVITFGTNFKSQGTLTTGATASKIFHLKFHIVSTSEVDEISRTTAM